MAWTVVDDDDDVIQVRASIDMKTQMDELKALITALEKRLPKETADERPS